MRPSALVIAAIMLLMSLAAPAYVEARAVHNFGCNECHKSGISFTDFGQVKTNVCLSCHLASNPKPMVLVTTGTSATPRGKFDTSDASNVVSNPLATANTSHMWGSNTEIVPQVGATTPTTYASLFNGRYGVSRGKITCNKCHDPHGDNANDSDGDSVGDSKILKVTAGGDALCRDCHKPWSMSFTDGLLSHSMVADYATRAAELNAAAVLAGKPAPFKATPTFAGEMRLVNVGGTMGVSCTTCHAPHYADSNSATADGIDSTELGTGDGHLLRADGPSGTDKSSLCQSCHTYKSHGDPASPTYVKVDCLVCHSGHSYNNDGPNANYYLLRRDKVDPKTSQNILDQDFTNVLTLLNDKVSVTATGFCERCHGDAQNIPNHALNRWTKDCRECHKHDVTDATFSWKNDSSVAVCGDCHGFPPYLHQNGNVNLSGTAGGYAYTSATHNYAAGTVGQTKNETTTPHLSHAGNGMPGGTATDYIFGSGGAACDPCHDGLNKHQEGDAFNSTTFRDIYFNTLAKGNTRYTVNLVSTYTNSTTGNCTNVYCHSNGGKRTGDANKTSTNFKFPSTAPLWGTGDADIIGQTSPKHECAFCHGNTTTTMATADRDNSVSHIKHVAKYACNVCHVQTATSTTAILVASRIGPNGKHVNGVPDIYFDTAYDLDSGAATRPLTAGGTPFNTTTAVCAVYCHSNGGSTTGPLAYATPDWDAVGSVVCGSCHGARVGDAAVIASGSHAKHVSDTNGPTLACSECHLNAASYTVAGGHADHINGAVTVDLSRCAACHAVDGGETTPVWGQNSTMDCRTCHSGTNKSTVETKTAPDKSGALTRGHNATAAYASGNPAASKQCTDCHNTAQAGHFDGTTNDDKLLSAGGSSCLNCHGPAGSAVKDGIVTHMSKACTACHDPHSTTGSTNLYMVRTTSTGNYNGTVAFGALVDTDSFDEVGAAAGANNDDLCATCHSSATGTSHNNREGTGLHADSQTHEGENCLTLCHKTHTEAAGAFVAGAGSSCNGCHGNPPATGAHMDGVTELHSRTAVHTTSETRDDCAYCHTGADLYTYDPGADQGAGRNHGNKTGRRAILATTVGYQRDTGTSHWFCATACHVTSASDGYWYTWDGSNETIPAVSRTPFDTALNCTACHYYDAASPNRTANDAHPDKLTDSHNRHFDKSKTCASCHAIPVDTSHITTSGVSDLAKVQGRAQALGDEATLDFTTPTTKYSFDDPGNTCSNTANNGLGCHATGSPVWNSGPVSCTACHTNKTTSAVNPTSGLHSVVPVVSGVQHDESFLYNGGGSTGNCETCHTTSPTVLAANHQNGTLEATRAAAGNTVINFAAAISYTDAVQPTCAPSLTGCHYEQPTKTVDWRRKWHEGAANATASCAGCHGDWINGWNTNVTHHTNAKAESTHGTKAGLTYECCDCHGLESATLQPYPFTSGTNDWRQNAGENTTLHGNGVINVNSNGTGFVRVAGISGCPTCHANWETDGKHAYTVTEWSLTTLNADAPTVTCATCHGGLTVGTNANNYWPDKAGNDGTEDNGGRHLIHMTRLAQAKYGETIALLLTDNGNGTADAKQKYLCAYCHTAPGNDYDHGDTATLPAEVFVSNAVRSSKTMWDTVDADATHASGNCSNVECHNGKATSATANFTWYGSGTQNCVVCHNDITSTTAGTTGATHQAHVGAAAATYGKAINCANCHGYSASWSPYTAPTNNHINGSFTVGTVGGGNVPFAYSGTYTNAATRTVGNCATNLCHNNGKNAATPAYTWQTAISGCAACHATGATLGSSHDPHMNAAFATTFGRTAVGCQECHDAVSASDMTGKTAHMDGSVTLKAGITYSGIPNSLSVSVGNTYGVCNASVCHQNGKGANVDSPTWNRTATPADNCTICHNNGSGAPHPGGRHTKHIANTAYVTSSCGSCHAGATVSTIGGTTHINGTANTGASISVHTAGSATCTNACHLVDISRGDWLDADVLGCADCHFAGKIAATAGAMPVSGLHSITPRVSGKTHDQTLNVATGCEACHTTIRAATTTHIKGSWTADNGSNNDRGLFAAYSEAATGSCMGSGVNLAAGCHRDNGEWGRKWTTTAANNDGSECANCHGGIGLGYTATAWVGGIAPDHTANWDGDGNTGEVMTGHSVCKSCHGFNGAADKDDNYVLTNIWNQGGPDTSMHGNSQITLNGGTDYNAADWGCDNAGCHLAAASGHHLADSGLTVQLGSFAAGGSCFGCHGNGSSQYWPDGSAYPDRAGVHPEHVLAIASKMGGGATLVNMNATCEYCHPTGQHTGDQGSSPADVSNTDSDNDGTADANTSYKLKKIIGGGDDSTGFYRAASTDKTCTTAACHASAPFTPGWYGDTELPGNVTNLAGTDNALRVNPEPGTVELTWTAPGDDGSLDGTAYRYDLRFSTSPIPDSATFDALPVQNQAKAPTVDRRGKAQAAIVNGLTPGSTYNFALKTYDEVGNVSALSNVATRAAQVDNVAPVFWGINAVSAGDESLDMAPNPDTNSVFVSWDAGRDHSHSLTTPLNYVVLWSEYSLRTHFASNGPMPSAIGTDACFDKTDAPLVQVTCGSTVPSTNEYRIKSAQTTALGYNVTGLPVGTVYNFLVRAKDLSGNVDSNRAELMAMAKTTPFLPITLQTQYTSVAIPTTSTGWTGLPGGSTSASDAQLGASYPGTAPGAFTLAQNAVVVWSPGGSAGSNFAINTNAWGLSYQIKITGNSNGATALTYQFGYITGKAFTALGTAKTMSIPRRAPARVIKFPLSTFKGMIPSGSKPAFVLKNTTASAYSVTLAYGSTANKGGILLFNQQDYNDLPTGLGSLSQSQVASTFVGGPVYRLTWNAASAVNGGQTIHYDVFGSIDGGATWPYVIGRNLTTNTVDWDPVGDGITGNQTNVKFKVLAGDGYRTGAMVDGVSYSNHSEAIQATPFTVNNTADIWTPAAITTLAAETRPKQGSVYLTWKAVGNDGFNHGTRATKYDIRFSTSPISDGATFDALPAQNRATNEPFPNFTGAVEGYELLGLTPDAPYYVAMKVGDDAGNWSPLSNVVSVQSGPKCGICHSTPPDESATAGNHAKHGYTKVDCGNCHGSEAATFATDHQDGILKLGWKTATPYAGIQSGARLYYTTDGTSGGTVIYDDTTGAGGFVNTGGDQIDNGTCSGFNAANASGCHGPATPSWDVATNLECSACHGLSSRTTDPYSRPFDATLDNGMVVPDQVKATPPVDNHGTSTGKYVGAHLKHLNSSFRLAKGDNCKLCHNDSIHADGTVDVAYDLNVTGAGALWTPNATGAGTPGTCGGTSTDNCHGSNTPSWDSAATVACNQCHGFGGKAYTVGAGSSEIGHVMDGTQVRACTWCHPAGHPQGTVQDTTSIMIPNNPLVGIAYRSGGIHLLKNINSRGLKTTEAEICWTCHDAQTPTKITEWAANNDANTGSSPYNYGALFTSYSGSFSGPTSNWLGSGTGAYWQSGTTQFQTIKAGKIQSTHSTNTGGTSTVAWDATNKRYNESLDAVADIRCSNCHDVHNMNKAPNDAVTGTPYLRGTWMGNPYNEDGPPLSTTTYLNVPIGSYGFGVVPRGGTGYRQLGGYFIDQNNVVPGTASTTANATLDDYPTAGWTQESSAGLCILCHGNDVDNMDQFADAGGLWLGTNGHSNSAIGGTFTNNANIFVNLTGGLTGLPTPVVTTSISKTTQVPDMAYQMQPGSGSTTRGFGYRGTTGTTNAGAYTPVTATLYAHYAYDWGATVSSGVSDIDQMYHQFSCSKCHNPHASRLPKLLITNCLDIQHNTWDDNKSQQSAYTAAALTDVDRFGGTGQRSAYYASAQNCHRYNNLRTAANKGGWNKVSMWTTANQ